MQADVNNFLVNTNQEEFLQILERRCQEASLAPEQTEAYLTSVRNDMANNPAGEPCTKEEATANTGCRIAIAFAQGQMHVVPLGLNPDDWLWGHNSNV